MVWCFCFVYFYFGSKKCVLSTYFCCINLKYPPKTQSKKNVRTWTSRDIKTLDIDNFSKHWPSGPMLSISRDVRLSVCLSVGLCVCLFTFEVPFNGLFAPTSRSRMSNISESLGKSNGKKWSNMWTFLFGSGLKSPRKKKVFFCWFCLTKHGGNHASRWIRDLWSKGLSLILTYP